MALVPRWRMFKNVANSKPCTPSVALFSDGPDHLCQALSPLPKEENKREGRTRDTGNLDCLWIRLIPSVVSAHRFPPVFTDFLSTQGLSWAHSSMVTLSHKYQLDGWRQGLVESTCLVAGFFWHQWWQCLHQLLHITVLECLFWLE